MQYKSIIQNTKYSQFILISFLAINHFITTNKVMINVTALRFACDLNNFVCVCNTMEVTLVE